MLTLEEAIQKRDLDAALECLRLDPAQVHSKTSMGVSILLLALYHELPELARAIRLQLAELSFFEAAAMGEAESIAKAIRRDPALVNAFAPDGYPVLGLAIFFRQPDLASFLIDHGADVNLRANNPSRLAPIHAACARKDLTTLELLLSKGANPNARDQGGFSPLDHAKASGNDAMEAILREAGASDEPA
jgi:ankyrin repeat protein